MTARLRRAWQAPVARRSRARAGLAVDFFADRVRYGRLGRYIWRSRRITGWTRGDEAIELARTCVSLPDGAVVVEIGSFLGQSTVLLAGARTVRGSGVVHAIDPFDGSGDAFSQPVYRRLREQAGGSLRARFDANLSRAGVSGRVVVHPHVAEDILPGWDQPIDLLFLDGNQSYESVRATFDGWVPFLKRGGVLAVHNSQPGIERHPTHDGSVRIVAEELHPPGWTDVHLTSITTFARKAGGP